MLTQNIYYVPWSIQYAFTYMHFYQLYTIPVEKVSFCSEENGDIEK